MRTNEMRQGRAAVVALVLALGFAMAGPAAESCAQDEAPLTVCREPYALCAAAECFVYNGVAYCACDLERGRSISEQFEYTGASGEPVNVCDVDRVGLTNGFLVSTYSLPSAALKGGSGAVYTCPGPDNARGGVAAPVGYAQCDGGLCFRSTVGRRFPGFPQRLARDEIICSCPITTGATPGASSPLGYQMFGPYAPTAAPGERCDPDACAACAVPSPTANGAKINVGAPTGSPDFLTLRLDGPPLPELNRCECACSTAGDGTTSCSLAADVP